MMSLLGSWKSCGLLLSASALALASVAARAAEEYEALSYKTDGGQLLYRLLKPKDYDPKKQYPLVLFLHGAGERGTDNGAQLRHVTGIFLTAENREKFPCFVLAPQCPSEHKWSEVDWGAMHSPQPAKAAKPMALTVKLIDDLAKQYSIDRKRLYIMGLSMGGYGTWDAIVRYPGMFAAAVPICGGGDETKAAEIAKMPIWVFHGRDDGVVKPARSRNMVEALKKAGGTPKYTEYPGVGHDSWVPASKEPELLPWLFSQKR